MHLQGCLISPCIYIFLGIIGKKSSPTRNKAKIEYIGEGGGGRQPSPHKLAFGVELDSKSHSKIVPEPILNPLTSHPPYYSRTNSKSVAREGVYLEKPKFHIGKR